MLSPWYQRMPRIAAGMTGWTMPLKSAAGTQGSSRPGGAPGTGWPLWKPGKAASAAGLSHASSGVSAQVQLMSPIGTPRRV